MAQIKINSGDTLSGIASANGTTVSALLSSNKDNPAVKSANLIIAGGSINIPDAVGSPAAGPAAGTGTPVSGSLDPASTVQGGAAQRTSSLGNLRIALRAALNEAGKERMATQYSQVAPLAGGVPGTLGGVVNMIRANLKSPIESVFSDITTTWKEDAAAAEKEKGRIQELRVQFGSAIPAGVTSLDEAIGYVTPLVDKENSAKLAKLQQEQVVDNDVEGWAASVAAGESIGSVPMAIRTKVRNRANVLIEEAKTKTKTEFENTLELFAEKKWLTYDDMRTAISSGGKIGNFDLSTLNGDEMREFTDYVDGLELKSKGGKSSGGNNFLGNLFGGGQSTAAATPAFGTGNFANISIDDRINQLKTTLGGGPAGANNSYLEQQLIKDGYNPNEIKKRTRTGITDWMTKNFVEPFIQ
jgi:LysM repeat protein